MKKRSAVILVNWGEILEKKRSYLRGGFSKVYTLLSKERKSWFPCCRFWFAKHEISPIIRGKEFPHLLPYYRENIKKFGVE